MVVGNGHGHGLAKGVERKMDMGFSSVVEESLRRKLQRLGSKSAIDLEGV